MRARLSLALAAALCAAAPATALAQSPAGSGYDETGIIYELPPAPTNLPATDDVAAPEGEVAPQVVSGGGGDDEPETVRTEAGAGTPTTTTASGGSLPFTGFDAGLVALMGLALVGTGIVLRRSRGAQHA